MMIKRGSHDVMCCTKTHSEYVAICYLRSIADKGKVQTNPIDCFFRLCVFFNDIKSVHANLHDMIHNEFVL